MKKIYILTTAFFLASTAVNAQTTDVLTGLNNPIFLELNGNDLYITDYFGLKILKIDITAQPPTPDTVVTDTNFMPGGIALNGNDLYIANRDFSNPHNISKLDITSASAILTIVDDSLMHPSGLAFNGNELYIAENGSGKISKIDITAVNPTATDVVTGLNSPYALALHGNDLYFTELTGTDVFKIDITAPTPTPTLVVTSLGGPSGLAIHGNYLYISESSANKISKIDITSTLPATPTTVITGLNFPFGLVFNGNDLFIAENGAGKIVKINVSGLSVNNTRSKALFNLYPNPTTNYITLSGLEKKENYTLYNMLGTALQKGTIENQKEIDISNFTKGVYFLQIENGGAVQFIKE